MKAHKDFWKKIEKFMIENWIDFKYASYIFGVAPQDLDKFSNKNYDFKRDPNTKIIRKTLRYLNKRKVKLSLRFITGKLLSANKSIDLCDTHRPLK